MKKYWLIPRYEIIILVAVSFLTQSCDKNLLEEEALECIPSIDEEIFYFFGEYEAEIYNYTPGLVPIFSAGVVGRGNIKMNKDNTFEFSLELNNCEDNNPHTQRVCLFFQNITNDEIILKGNFNYLQWFKNLNRSKKYPNRYNPRSQSEIEGTFLTGRITFIITEAPTETLVGIHGTGIYNKNCDLEEFQIYFPINWGIDLRFVISPPDGNPVYDYPDVGYW